MFLKSKNPVIIYMLVQPYNLSSSGTIMVHHFTE